MEQENEKNLTLEEILQLMERFDQSSLQSFFYQRDGEKLKLSKTGKVSGKPEKKLVVVSGEEEHPEKPSEEKWEEKRKNPSEEEEPRIKNPDVEVKAPLAGVFYRASKPGEAPFVREGQQVKKGETLGLMEAMKMINEIPSPCDGIIRSIEAEDGTFAEYNAVLMRIEESGTHV
jgi:acetyl-CoA carboxylase biotin carboxyl carrier protein